MRTLQKMIRENCFIDEKGELVNLEKKDFLFESSLNFYENKDFNQALNQYLDSPSQSFFQDYVNEECEKTYQQYLNFVDMFKNNKNTNYISWHKKYFPDLPKNFVDQIQDLIKTYDYNANIVEFTQKIVEICMQSK